MAPSPTKANSCKSGSDPSPKKGKLRMGTAGSRPSTMNSGPLNPWTWADELDLSGFERHLSTPASEQRPGSRGETAMFSAQATAGSPSKPQMRQQQQHRGGGDNGKASRQVRARVAAPQVLNLEGTMYKAEPRMRKTWMRNQKAGGVREGDRRSASSLSIMPTSFDAPDIEAVLAPPPPKLDLSERNLREKKLTAKGGRKSAGAAAVPGAHHIDVQPYLGPELKKALAKQGMRVQKLSLEADEWDTEETRFMLGYGFSDKQEERAAKHLDWYIRNMGPKFVKKMGMSAAPPSSTTNAQPAGAAAPEIESKLPLPSTNAAGAAPGAVVGSAAAAAAAAAAAGGGGGGGGGGVLHQVMGATSSSSQDVSSLMKSGHMFSSSVIDTSKLLNLDSLAQGVAKAEILPGLKAAKMEVYSMWDDGVDRDLSLSELFKARTAGVGRGGNTQGASQRGTLARLFDPKAKQVESRKGRGGGGGVGVSWKHPSKGNLRLGKATVVLSPEAMQELASTINQGAPAEISGQKSPKTRKNMAAPVVPPMTPISRGSTPSHFDTSGDPGRGGFHAVEKEEELERLRLDVEEAERHWSGSEGGTAPGSKAGSRGSTPWDHYRGTAACSF